MEGLTDEQVEHTRTELKKRAAIAGQFYDDLIAQRYPADAACRLVEVWLAWDLGEWVEDD